MKHKTLFIFMVAIFLIAPTHCAKYISTVERDYVNQWLSQNKIAFTDYSIIMDKEELYLVLEKRNNFENVIVKLKTGDISTFNIELFEGSKAKRPELYSLVLLNKTPYFACNLTPNKCAPTIPLTLSNKPKASHNQLNDNSEIELFPSDKYDEETILTVFDKQIHLAQPIGPDYHYSLIPLDLAENEKTDRVEKNPDNSSFYRLLGLASDVKKTEKSPTSPNEGKKENSVTASSSTESSPLPSQTSQESLERSDSTIPTITLGYFSPEGSTRTFSELSFNSSCNNIKQLMSSHSTIPVAISGDLSSGNLNQSPKRIK